MSTGSRKKGKEPKKAVFVESSAQLTKSRNMAEQNILRHKLKDLDDQRRRSILALKEKEKLLIKDLETQKRHGSLTKPTLDVEKSTIRTDHQGPTNGSSRRNSYKSSDDNDNAISNITNIINNTNNRNHTPSTKNGNNDLDCRKHLWKYPRASFTVGHGDDDNKSIGTVANNIRRPDYGKAPKEYGSEEAKSRKSLFSETAKNISLEKHKSISCSDSGISSKNRSTDSTNENSVIASGDLSLKSSDISSTPPRALHSRGKSNERNILEEPSSYHPEMTSTLKIDKPSKPRTKCEERRDRSMSRRSGSLKLSSIEDIDNELNTAYGMINKHARKLSRSVNINIIGDDTNDVKKSCDPFTNSNADCVSSKSGPIQCNQDEIRSRLKQTDLSYQDAQTPSRRRSKCKTVNASHLKKALDKFENPHQNLFDNPTTESNQRRTKHSKSQINEDLDASCNLNSNSLSSSSTSTASKSSPRDSTRRNSVGRNRIVLSPLASRTPRTQPGGYVPTCAEQTATVRQTKKKRGEKLDPLRQSTGNHVASDSDSSGSNVSRRGSIPENYRRCSVQAKLDLPARPLSSWSQRRRSIVFGDKAPITPSEVLNDTQAQWEELGDFLGEIRKQHNMDQAKISSTRHSYCKTGSSSINHLDKGSSNNSSFATLVEQRLLPRRHSESNIILLSHAARGKTRDVLDFKRETAGGGSSRRKSCIPPEHQCAMSGHNRRNSSVKKLVTIHNALQSSALSMADMEYERF